MIPKERKYIEGDYEKHILPLNRDNMKDYVDRHIKGGWSDEIDWKRFQRYLKEGWIFLFELNKEFIGYLVLTPDKIDKSSLFINQINVKKEFQGRGYGSEILRFSEEKAREFGFKKMRLCVFEDNPSFNLYKRFGYKQLSFIRKMHLRFMEKVLGI